MRSENSIEQPNKEPIQEKKTTLGLLKSLDELRKNGPIDLEERNKIIEANKELIEGMVDRFLLRQDIGPDLREQMKSDLVQEIVCELMTAMDKFDFRKSEDWVAYANSRIYRICHFSQEMVGKDLVYIPEYIKEAYRAAIKQLNQELRGEKIDLSMLVQRILDLIHKSAEPEEQKESYWGSLTEKDIIGVIATLEGENYIPFNPLVDSKRGEEIETINPDNRLFHSEELEEIKEMVDHLKNERQKEVIKLRFGLDGEEKTLEEIGKMFNVTKEEIRQVEARALMNLREISEGRGQIIRQKTGGKRNKQNQ
ncbi:MAG: sigma-70 family RNA polymerase sigma factor [Patescibacteria group bacterium]